MAGMEAFWYQVLEACPLVQQSWPCELALCPEKHASPTSPVPAARVPSVLLFGEKETGRRHNTCQSPEVLEKDLKLVSSSHLISKT